MKLQVQPMHMSHDPDGECEQLVVMLEASLSQHQSICVGDPGLATHMSQQAWALRVHLENPDHQHVQSMNQRLHLWA